MKSTGDFLSGLAMFRPLSETEKTCAKHGIGYVERVFKNHTVGCPECRKEAEAQRAAEEAEARKLHEQQAAQEAALKRLGDSGIPKRFADKTIKGYAVDAGNARQVAAVEFVKAYAHEFSKGSHSGRNLALLGNAGNGKTHLACAVGRHVIRNCGGKARFLTVAELNRMVRESKRFDSDITESEVIRGLGAYDLLIIDEVGVQSGTDAEARALFDVFNERYQNCKPTVLISNLLPADFAAAVGDRIVDRIKEDGGAVLLFDWASYRE